ncbi:MAG: hypothetical protein SH850_16600 [Planctomycetaceae bacterium]|nr:hypothetical protein [Planctomycetaceae bacterium]
MTPDERDLILSLFQQSCEIYCKAPVYWKDPHGCQAWAKRQSFFRIERGIVSSPEDTIAAGRKEFSRMRLSLQERGLIHLTALSATTRSICLSAAGLTVAEELTSTKAPADLRAVIKAMEPKQTPRDPRLVKLARTLKKVTQAGATR